MYKNTSACFLNPAKAGLFFVFLRSFPPSEFFISRLSAKNFVFLAKTTWLFSLFGIYYLCSRDTARELVRVGGSQPQDLLPIFFVLFCGSSWHFVPLLYPAPFGEEFQFFPRKLLDFFLFFGIYYLCSRDTARELVRVGGSQPRGLAP